MRILLRDDFASLADPAFTGEHEGEAFTLTLTGVSEPSDVRFAGSARDPFALRFVSATALPQATYALSNSAIGDEDIFIVPTARDGDGYHYEAVFT